MPEVDQLETRARVGEILNRWPARRRDHPRARGQRPAWLRALAFAVIVRWPERLTPEQALGDILAMRDCTAFSAVASRAHEYAFHGNPHVPVTVAWGTRDKILLHRQAPRAQRRLPGVRHIDLRACGHMPMSDAPARVAAAILATTKEARA